ncbi:MAG TPA: ATP-binding cassette domain-containing protein, partial [Roseimicrobium sp.]|nr:ATP-binding cassette domain-containing protein [Roseimicrobium sp.]
MTVDSTTPWIEMKDVSVCAPGDRKPKAAGINWRLFAGDFWVVGGLHGSGKSSWINTAAMLQRCLEGEHLVGGREISTLSEHDLAAERKRVGLVFDGGGRPFSRMTVAENVALPLCYHSDTAIHEVMDEVRLLLHLVGLEGLAERSASTLGKNTQQRVALARAIALRPDLLFLDNPLS